MERIAKVWFDCWILAALRQGNIIIIIPRDAKYAKKKVKRSILYRLVFIIEK
jgi:hypothetical protein